MHGRILARRACNSCGYTMKMSSRYHRLLIYDVKQTTKIDGMGPFNLMEIIMVKDIYTMVYIRWWWEVEGQWSIITAASPPQKKT